MLSLSYKMLFRKKSTLAAILAVALLVAIISSMYAIVNFINSQTSAIGQLASVGNKYLVLSKNCVSLSDSHLNWMPVNAMKNFTEVKLSFCQQILEGNIQTSSGKYAVSIRGVENVSAYLKSQPAYVNGTAAKNQSEANIGVLLAKACNVNVQDIVNVSVGNVRLSLRIAGLIRSQGQLDSEILVPIETANTLAGNGDVSFIEFSFKENVNRQAALNRLSALMPKDVEVVKVQQTALFLQESVNEALNFLAVWSISVYFVVAGASYVVSTRLIVESEYELVTLKAIGAKRRRIFIIVFSYTIVIALAGSVLGLSLGIAGAGGFNRFKVGLAKHSSYAFSGACSGWANIGAVSCVFGCWLCLSSV